MTPEEIYSLRKKTGLSMAKFGEPLGVTRQAVDLWEKGKVTPSNMAIKFIQLVYKEYL